MRLSPILALALALVAASPAFAQAPAPAPMAPAAPAAPAPRKPANYPGVSPAGNAILTKLDQQGDPGFVQLIRQRKAAQDQLLNAIIVPTIDVDKVAGIMNQLDLLQGQIRMRSSARVLTALKALPEADRGPFLRAISRQIGPTN